VPDPFHLHGPEQQQARIYSELASAGDFGRAASLRPDTDAASPTAPVPTPATLGMGSPSC